MLDPTYLSRREAYRTRVKGIWRCVENVSINCGIAVNKMDSYVPPQPRIRNPDSYTNFLANVYAINLAKLTFLYLICRLQRLTKRNEDGSELAYSSAKFFEASCVS